MMILYGFEIKGAAVKIGIAGSGNVGGTLGSRWAAAGHQVAFGSRNPGSADMLELAAKAGVNARAASLAEAVASADVVLVSTPWPATPAALETAGSFAGKIVIDATNPLMPRLEGLEFANTTSGAEQLSSWVPGARVVKAFNTVGFGVMANPKFGDRAASLPYCGDDAEAKRVVHGLAEELGFEPFDAGPLRQARVLEPFALLWISLAMVHGYGRDIAFQLMRR